MKIEGACHPVISECPFNTHVETGRLCNNYLSNLYPVNSPTFSWRIKAEIICLMAERAPVETGTPEITRLIAHMTACNQ